MVQNTLSRLQNDNADFNQADYLAQTKDAVEGGFNAAAEALSNLGLLNSQTQDKLDAAKAQVLDGLSQLAADSATAVSPPASTAALQGIAVQSRQSAEVQIVTNEGDVVKIRLTQSSAASQSAVSLNQNGQQVDAAQLSSSQTSSFSISIEGDLNANEQKSIQDLLQVMDGVSTDFFSGDVQSAVDHVQAIGLDNAQLKGFSMNLSTQRSIQAVAAYVQTQQPEQRVLPEKIKQAADFLGQVGDMLSTAQSALQPFSKPLPAFIDLLNAVIHVAAADSKQPDAADQATDLQQVVQPLADSALAGETTAQATQL
jgi:hypothetical protein